jgi:hypothetical protein
VQPEVISVIEQVQQEQKQHSLTLLTLTASNQCFDPTVSSI